MDQPDELFNSWDREEKEKNKEKEQRALLYLMSREIDAEREEDPFYDGF